MEPTEEVPEVFPEAQERAVGRMVFDAKDRYPSRLEGSVLPGPDLRFL